jgi:hypothetical protein
MTAAKPVRVQVVAGQGPQAGKGADDAEKEEFPKRPRLEEPPEKPERVAPKEREEPPVSVKPSTRLDPTAPTKPPPEPKAEAAKTEPKPAATTTQPLPAKEPPAARKSDQAAAPARQEPAPKSPPAPVTPVAPLNAALTAAEATGSATTWTFTAEQIRRLGVRRLSELLEHVPGMNSVRDVQGFARSGLRGLVRDGDVLVLVDGLRRNSLYEGRPFFDWPLANAKQVTVRVGRGVDSGAPGNFRAVVRIITARSAPVQAEASGAFPLGIGAHASGNAAVGKVRFFADADFSAGGGQSLPILHDSIDEGAKAQQLRIANNPAGFTDEGGLGMQALGGLEWDRGEQGTLRASARYGFERRGALVGAYSTVTPGSSLEAHAIDAQLQYRRVLSERVSLDVQGWFEQHSTLRLFQVTPPGFQTSALPEGFFPEGVREGLRFKERGLGADLRFTFEAPKEHRFLAGLSIERTGLYDYAHTTNLAYDNTLASPLHRVEPAFLVPQITPEPVLHRITTGIFGDYRWTPSKALAINLSARADLFQVPLADDPARITQMRWLPAFSPRIGFAIRPVESWVTRISFAHGGAAASLKEQFEGVPSGAWNSGRVAGNPALAGFESDTAELGLLWQGAVGTGKARVEAVGFFERVAPIIPRLDTKGTHILGGEASVRLDVSARAGGSISVSVAKAYARDAPPDEQELSYLPWLVANAQVTVPLGSYLSLDANARFGTSRIPAGAPRDEAYRLPMYVRFGAQVRTEWLVRDHLQFAAGLYDFTLRGDADPAASFVAMPEGIPRQPYSARLTARARF